MRHWSDVGLGCEDVGKRNGKMLADMAVNEKKVIHQIWAEHSRKSGKKQTSTVFNGLRAVVNLVRGCEVMVTQNIAYKFGLANGTRGTLVAVVYSPNAPMGTMPEALVLDVPEYSGPCFYPGQPTWVPILPSVSINRSAGSRTQFPVVASFALTINKAKGRTI